MKQLKGIAATRHVLVIDALRYSLHLEKRAFSSLRRALRTIEKSDDGRRHPAETPSITAIGSAWGILDIVHRLRGLITQIAGLAQKNPEVQLFLRKTAQTEDFRNIYQHLNSAISRISGKTNPIMGVISWVTRNPQRSITLFLGTATADIEAHTVAYDTWEHKFAQQLLFSAAKKDIELDKLHASCLRIEKFIDDWLEFKGYLSREDTKVSIIRFQIKQGYNTSLNPATPNDGPPVS